MKIYWLNKKILTCKEDAGWVGRVIFAGKSFDSVIRVLLRFFQCFKYTYVACI